MIFKIKKSMSRKVNLESIFSETPFEFLLNLKDYISLIKKLPGVSDERCLPQKTTNNFNFTYFNYAGSGAKMLNTHFFFGKK